MTGDFFDCSEKSMPFTSDWLDGQLVKNGGDVKKSPKPQTPKQN